MVVSPAISGLKRNGFHGGCFPTALCCCLLHRVAGCSNTLDCISCLAAKPSTICLKPVHLVIKPRGGGNRITFHQGPIVLCPVHLVLPWQFQCSQCSHSQCRPPFQEPLNLWISNPSSPLGNRLQPLKASSIKQFNVVKTIVNHPKNNQYYRWYSAFPNGWFMALF